MSEITNKQEELKEDYLSKFTEIKSVSEAPKQLETANVFEVIRERRSVRHYDSTYQIDDAEICELLEIATLAPSSSNLQPWRFIVIKNQEAKETLLPIANNQQQIVDASVVIAVLGDIEAYKTAGNIYDALVEKEAMTQEVRDFYVDSIHKTYGNFSKEVATNTALIDGGLVSMQLMLAAKAKGYDTVPMGGFDHAKFIETFDIPANLKPVMLISLGKGLKAGFEKIRRPLDEIVTWK